MPSPSQRERTGRGLPLRAFAERRALSATSPVARAHSKLASGEVGHACALRTSPPDTLYVTCPPYHRTQAPCLSPDAWNGAGTLSLTAACRLAARCPDDGRHRYPAATMCIQMPIMTTASKQSPEMNKSTSRGSFALPGLGSFAVTLSD
eukprot:6440015-Prymnesium_polylepis.1